MDKVVRTAKEIARHVLHRTGTRRGPAHVQPPERRDRFAQIYREGVWQLGEDDQPLSGRGSSIEATSIVRSTLPKVFAELDTSTVLDIGCGDMTWMGTLEFGARYVGVDIVPSVIAANQARYPHLTFDCLDGVVDDLPDADTVLCREVMFHLSFADAAALLANLRKKPRRWLIATSDDVTWLNADIETGDFRLLNLSKGPFRFPKPVKTIRDDGVSPGRYLCVWAFDTLPILA